MASAGSIRFLERFMVRSLIVTEHERMLNSSLAVYFFPSSSCFLKYVTQLPPAILLIVYC